MLGLESRADKLPEIQAQVEAKFTAACEKFKEDVMGASKATWEAEKELR
jgi:hypothetical protein